MEKEINFSKEFADRSIDFFSKKPQEIKTVYAYVNDITEIALKNKDYVAGEKMLQHIKHALYKGSLGVSNYFASRSIDIVIKFIEDKSKEIQASLNDNYKKRLYLKDKDLYDIYIQCCLEYQNEKPTLSKLAYLSKNISKNRWQRLLTDFNFCFGLKQELIKKRNWAKETKKKNFWKTKLDDFEQFELNNSILQFQKKVSVSIEDLENKRANKKIRRKYLPLDKDDLNNNPDYS